MNVLIVGNGGREYSLGKKISESFLVGDIYFAKGNGGTKSFGTNIDIDPLDIEALADFAEKEDITLTIVGPENPLALGIVDEFQSRDLKIFGVNKENSQFESSKDYTKNFLKKYNIPSAEFETFDNLDDAKAYLEDKDFPIVLKADGLAYGKGVFIPQTLKEGIENLEEIFSDEGFGDEKVVIEEFLVGKEVSSICLVSNNRIIPLPNVRDYKRIGDDDTGENTGGVGCVSPVEDIQDWEQQQMDEIVTMIEDGLEAGGYEYTGVLFIGYMITKNQVYVLEFNVRFGDPETELILEKVESDLLKHIMDTVSGSIQKEDIIINDNYYVGIVGCSEGYPRDFETGNEITGIDDVDAIFVHNATQEKDSKYYNNGGRVLMVIGCGDDLESARIQAYEEIEKVDFSNMYYRKDIGK